MSWLNVTRWLQGESKLRQRAEHIAARCEEAVWRLCREHALALNPAQARGYVRARASLIVNHAVESAAGDLRACQRLRELTMDALVRQIGAQLRAVRPALRTREAA